MKPDWPRCGKVLGPRKPRCQGARVSGGAYCWAHLDPTQLSDALEVLKPDDDLDLRGTEVTPDLLAQILDRLRVPDEGIRIREAHCCRAVFTGRVTITGMRVSGPATFNDASFPAGAAFTNVAFGADANFSGASFGGDTTFTSVEFKGTASFISVQFDKLMMDPACTATTLLLNRLQATGPVDVCGKFENFICRSAEFTGRSRFRLSRTRLRLTDTVFTQPATVESAGDPVAVRSLQGVDAEHLTLASVDLGRCLISGLLRPERLRLDGRCVFAPTPRGWRLRYRCLPWRWTARDALFEEHLWRGQHQRPQLGWSRLDGPDADQDERVEVPPLDAARLAVLYRQLRRAVEDARNEPGAADLYYGEMEMRRLSTRRWDERTLLTAYWLVSGYSLRATRAMLMLAALLVIAAEVLQRAGFPGHAHGYVDCLLYASGSVLSLDLNGHLPGTLTDWGQVIRMVLRVGGPVLLGLGALALRGRVKR